MAASSPSSIAAGLPDDDDEVVAELDVYLSKALADKLYLVQYPEKSADGYRKGGECIAARVKPGQRKIELDFALNNDEPSCNTETTSGTDLSAKIKREPQESGTTEQSGVKGRAGSANIGQRVKQEPSQSAVRVKVEPSSTDAARLSPGPSLSAVRVKVEHPSTDATDAARLSPGEQAVADTYLMVKVEPPAEATTDQVTHIQPPTKAEADQSKRMEIAATLDPATYMIEPATNDGAGRSIKAEPGSSEGVCQTVKEEPSTSGPTSHMSATIKTHPQYSGTIRPCARATTSSRDTYTMTSTVPITCPENYAVGLLLPGELHLTPLHAIVHMAPVHYRHQEGQSSERADANAAPPQAPKFGGRGATAKKGPQAPDDDSITLPGSSVDEETSNDKRCKRFRQEHSPQVQPEDDSEPWLEATFHSCYSEMSLYERELLVGPRDQEPDPQQFMSGEEQYLERLLAKDQTARHPDDARALIDTVPQWFRLPELSMHVIGNLPLEDRITAILKNAKVVQFAKLTSLLPKAIKEETVIEVLQYVAVLVQGCWVVKSEELYPRRGFSEKTGVRAESLCKARDLLLYMYTEARHVKKSTFAETLRQGLCAFPAEDVKALLGDIGRPTPDGWEFLLPYDADFTNAHPDVVLKQQEEWDKRRDALSRTFRPSIMARLQKRRVSEGESSSRDGGGNATYRSRTTPKPVLSSRRSSSCSPATKLSKKTN